MVDLTSFVMSSDEEESDDDVEQKALMEQAEAMMSESDEEGMDLAAVKAEVALKKVAQRRSSSKK
jgi:uncharacterized protein (UPF0335 family)